MSYLYVRSPRVGAMQSKVQAEDDVRKGRLQQALEADFGLLEADVPGINFDDEIGRYEWPLQVKRWLWNDKYYKGLAAYCRRHRIARALELGTCTGASSVCLSKFAGHVTTCDITDWSVADPRILTGKITFIKCSSASDVLYLDFRSYDMVFVDIDHSGLLERLVHARLVEQAFMGDVFYDDISANLEMRRFWESVQEPKLELDWHDAGFGVVRYCGEREFAMTRGDGSSGIEEEVSDGQ